MALWRRLADAHVRLIQALADRIDRVDLKALSKTRLVADQSPQLGPQSVGERFGECGQQDARFRIVPR